MSMLKNLRRNSKQLFASDSRRKSVVSFGPPLAATQESNDEEDIPAAKPAIERKLTFFDLPVSGSPLSNTYIATG